MKHQNTISSFQFHEMIPDEKAAVNWFEVKRWPQERYCPHCGGFETVECIKPQPYRCKSCRKHFSAKTGTVLQSSKLPIKKWLYAMYLMSVSKKGLSSLQLARELGIAQEAAWRLGHKIREAWNQDLVLLDGEVEIDETFIGGKEKNKHKSKKLKAERGASGKHAVFGMKQRDGRIKAFPIDKTDKEKLTDYIRQSVGVGTAVYTNCHRSYYSMNEYRHKFATHCAGEFVRGQLHTNRIESFWSVLKRGFLGTNHYISVKHLARYIDEFCMRQNNLDMNAIYFMSKTSFATVGRRQTHDQLVGGH